MGTAAPPSQPQNWVIYFFSQSLRHTIRRLTLKTTSRLEPCTFNVPSIDPPIFKFASRFEKQGSSSFCYCWLEFDKLIGHGSPTLRTSKVLKISQHERTTTNTCQINGFYLPSARRDNMSLTSIKNWVLLTQQL